MVWRIRKSAAKDGLGCPVTIMDTSDKLEKLKTWAVYNYFKFRDVMSPYLENLPTTFAELSQVEQERSESGETDEEDDSGAKD